MEEIIRKISATTGVPLKYLGFPESSPEEGTDEYNKIVNEIEDWRKSIFIRPDSLPLYHLFTESSSGKFRPHPYCAIYFGNSFDIDELKERFILETKGVKKAIIYYTHPDGTLEPVQEFWDIWGDCHGNPVSDS